MLYNTITIIAVSLYGIAYSQSEKSNIDHKNELFYTKIHAILCSNKKFLIIFRQVLQIHKFMK